jgi:flagellar hook assembly protein FlgD
VLKATRHVDTGGAENAAGVEFAARPNPFSHGTALHFAIPVAARVTLKVYDVNGRLVTTLVDKELSAGPHRVEWESAEVSPGVYLAIIQAGTERKTRKLTLLP